MIALRALLVLLLTLTAVAAQDAGGVVQLLNTRCIDGQPVDAKLEPVLVRVNESTFAIRVSSRENAEAIRKMRPEAALRAVVAFNDRAVQERANPAKP